MCRLGSEAYWLERPVGLISKATGQRLTPDYITNPPRAAVLCQYRQQHPRSGLQNPDAGARPPGTQSHAHLGSRESDGEYQKLGRAEQRTSGSEMSLMLKDVGSWPGRKGASKEPCRHLLVVVGAERC